MVGDILSERFEDSRAFYKNVIGLDGVTVLIGSSSSGRISERFSSA
jgi:hypothetical protein